MPRSVSSAVFPSASSATPAPPPGLASLPPCCAHFAPERTNTQAAPRSRPSSSSAALAAPPISAVCAPAASATLVPKPTPHLHPVSNPPPVSSCGGCVKPDAERLKTHADPKLSWGAPIRAVLPLADSVTPKPNSPRSAPSVRPSLLPSWVQVEPERVKPHAAPAWPSSSGPPTSAVSPSAESATLAPKRALPDAPAPVSSACCVQVEPERVKTHAAPAPALSSGAPTSAVLPSAESATALPNLPLPTSPLAVIFEPCWIRGSIGRARAAEG